jgi:anti-sigma-K factor RskA
VHPIGDHPRDDLAAYAVDALEGDERRAIEDHLAGCVACRALLAEHHDVLAGLTPDELPPPSVWPRVAADTGAGVSGAGAPRSRPPAHARRRTTRSARSRRLVGAGAALVGAAAAAAVLVVAVVAGVVTWGSDDGADDLTELAQQAAEAGDVVGGLADPDGRPVAEVVSSDGGSFVVLDDLEALPAGRAYQLWSLDGPEPVSLGVLGDGRTEVVAVHLPATVTDVAISDEPATGVTAPTGPVVATGSIAHS